MWSSPFLLHQGKGTLRCCSPYTFTRKCPLSYLVPFSFYDRAVRTCKDALARDGEEGGDVAEGTEGFTFTMRPADVTALRGTASEITERGAKLFDLLKREAEIREPRASALRFLEAVASSLDTKCPEHLHVDRAIRDAVASLKDSISSLERQVADLVDDEKTLESKIKKKQEELARSQRRLESLQTVRPAFLDEYEKLEAELAQEYEAYVLRCRNLDYLQHELDEHNRREKERVELANRALRRLQKRLKEEEFKAFRGDENVGDNEDVSGGGAGVSRGAAAARGVAASTSTGAGSGGGMAGGAGARAGGRGGGAVAASTSLGSGGGRRLQQRGGYADGASDISDEEDLHGDPGDLGGDDDDDDDLDDGDF